MTAAKNPYEPSPPCHRWSVNLLLGAAWKTKTRLAVFTWIEARYDPVRRHSSLNYKPPNNFERIHQKKQSTAKVR